MRRQALLGTVLVVVVLLAGATTAIPAQEVVPAPPVCPPRGPLYERAILFSGQATDWIVHLGLYDAAVDHGFPPDVILGTSGGAIAAGVVAAYPDRARRCELLGSEGFHRMVLATRIARPWVPPVAVRALGWWMRGSGLACGPPKLFVPPVFDVPQNLAPEFCRPFPTEADRPRLILIAGLLNPAFFRPTHGDQKYYTEAWFTDRETGGFLAGQPSATGTNYPDSYVRRCGHVPAEVCLNAAIRASIAEPYMVAPALVNGHYYTGGGVNLLPLELARTVARRVMMARDQPLELVKEIGSDSAFGYSQRRRQEAVLAQPADVVVDLTNPPGPEVSFWPEVKRLRLVSGVPEDRAAFLKKVRGLYCYGYEQARAAFRASPARTR